MKRLFIPLPAMNTNTQGTAKREEKQNLRHHRQLGFLGRGKLCKTDLTFKPTVKFISLNSVIIFSRCLFWVVFDSLQ